MRVVFEFRSLVFPEPAVRWRWDARRPRAVARERRRCAIPRPGVLVPRPAWACWFVVAAGSWARRRGCPARLVWAIRQPFAWQLGVAPPAAQVLPPRPRGGARVHGGVGFGGGAGRRDVVYSRVPG
eukprot:5050076-Lingulodinium_polyedra.AAC.1